MIFPWFSVEQGYCLKTSFSGLKRHQYTQKGQTAFRDWIKNICQPTVSKYIYKKNDKNTNVIIIIKSFIHKKEIHESSYDFL